MVLATSIITILCCLFGAYYNLTTLKLAILGEFDDVEEIKDATYFYQVFCSMSAVCLVFYLCLIVFSIDLITGNFRTVMPFTVVAVLEVVYLAAVAKMWKHPMIGYSVACASGVANGGLMVQFFVLLPLWAPIVLWLAK